MLQSFLQGFAVYFVIWWMALFAVLPIGLRTQGDERDIVLGTVESAPARFRGLFVFMTTTLVAGLVYALWYFASTYLGWDFDALPQFGPKFEV